MINISVLKQPRYFLIITAAVLILQGCVAIQPFPLAARSGDTITLALGSPEGVTKDNLVIKFYDSNSVEYLVPNTAIRAVTKIYPDKKSTAWIGSDTLHPEEISENSAHGGWLTVLALDLPTLPVGNGYFDIDVVAGASVTFPVNSKPFTDVQINMEILPDSPNPAMGSTFDYLPFVWSFAPVAGDLASLEPQPHILIKQPYTPGLVDLYGAIQIEVTAPTLSASGGSVATDKLRIIADDQTDNLNSQRQVSWARDGDLFTVNIISPNGMYYYESRFSIVLRDDGASFPVDPVIDSIKYYDLDGVEVFSGPAPTWALVQ